MRRKNIPRELLIGDNLYRIKFVRKIPDQDDNVLGLCDPGEHVIYVKTGQRGQELLDTLLHEIIHALHFEHDFEIPHKVVYKLGAAMAQLCTDNF